MARALKSGGAALFHEYYDYASWRLAPHSALFESYVGKIIARWRAAGGEPDIALALPALLAQAGLQVASVQPHVFAAKMDDFASRWPMGFARGSLPTLIDYGDVTREEGTSIAALLNAAEHDPNTLIITPGVLHIAAMKPEQTQVSGVSIA